MAIPVYAAAGAGAASATNDPSADYPTGITAGHLLVAHVVCHGGTVNTTQSGWTHITGATQSPITHRAFYRVADGTESGSYAFDTNGGTGAYARIYRFTGTPVSGPVEDSAAAGGAVSTVSDVGVTTGGADRLAVNLVALSGSFGSLGSFTGESGGDWTEATKFTSTTGDDATLQLQTAGIASAGTINGGTTSGGGFAWVVIGFAIKPYEPQTYTKTGGGVVGVAGSGVRNVVLNRTGGGVVAVAASGSTDAFGAGGLSCQITFGGAVNAVTGDVKNVRVTRGRPFNLDRVQAGTATVTLVNGEKYDPSNVDGPYYGLILPLNELRLRRWAFPFVYELFKGPVERWQPVWVVSRSTDPGMPRAGAQDAQVQAADAFMRLATAVIESDQATLTTALTGSNNDLVFTARKAGGDGDNITVEYVVSGTDTPLGVGTNEPLAGNAIFTGESREAKWSSSLGGFGRTGASTRTSVTPVEIQVSGSDITVNVATNGAGAATSTASQIKTALEADANVAALVTVALAPGNDGSGVVTAMAKTNLAGGKWPQEPTGDRIDRVLDLVGWPSADRDIDPGAYEVVARGFSASENVSALAHIQEVADSELGYVFVAGDGKVVYHDGSHRSTAARSTSSQATYSDDGAGFPYFDLEISFDSDRIFNDVQITPGYQGALPQVAVDSASQAAYGPRTLTRATQLAEDADALVIAEALRDAFAQPRLRFDSVTLRETDDQEGWAEGVLGREIGDLVTVRTNPPGHSTTVAYECFVESVEQVAEPGLPWQVTLKLSVAAESISAPPPPSGSTGPLLDSDGDDFVLDSGTAGVLG